MGEYLKDVPEFVELELGESLISRTETLGQSRAVLSASTASDAKGSERGEAAPTRWQRGSPCSRIAIVVQFNAVDVPANARALSPPRRNTPPLDVRTSCVLTLVLSGVQTASFRELGPPDLCHIIKTTGKAGQKEVCFDADVPSFLRKLTVYLSQIGSYHYVSGVDASSSASLAAYINSLTYTVEETPSWFFGSTSAKSPWRIRGGAFCSFNAFSRVDVRVEVKIPGGVEAYVIDVRGERCVPLPPP
jgi:hypothetical protein